MEDRKEAEAKGVEIERMTLNLAGYERWQQLYAPEDPAQPLTLVGSAVEEVVDDIDEVDRYFDRLNSGAQFSMSGADLSDDEGWV